MVLTITFEPDEERQNINVNFSCKTTLAPTNPARTSLYVAGENSTGEVQIVEMVPQIPGQVDIYGGEQERPASLKLIKLA